MRKPFVDRTKLTTAERLNRRRFYYNLIRRPKYRATQRRAPNAPKAFEIAATVRKQFPILRNKQGDYEALVMPKPFSFMENPAETYKALCTISEYIYHNRKFEIEIEDDYCRDIAPYLLLSLISSERPGCLKAVRYRAAVGKVLSALQLNNLPKVSRRRELSGIWPFPVQYHATRRLDNINFYETSSRQEKASNEYKNHLDECLSHFGFQLTEEGANKVRTILAELLDNSRHGLGDSDSEGAWWLSGFMAQRDASTPLYQGKKSSEFHIYLTLFTPGLSIAKNLDGATEEYIRSTLDDYYKKHSSVCPKPVLSTIMSLSDGITSDSGGGGGCGMSKLINLINEIGSDLTEQRKPMCSILSGRAWVTLQSPYNDVPICSEGMGGEIRAQFFNEAQRRDDPPDEAFYKKLSPYFPGTLFSARFLLDQDVLERRFGDGEMS